MRNNSDQLAIQRFMQAAALLPPRQRHALAAFSEIDKARAEEFRLRMGQPLTVLLPRGEVPVPGCPEPIQGEDLSAVFEIATQASAHTVLDRVCNGFITVQGGHRIGLCGAAVVQEGSITNLRQLSSLAIRIAREISGAAEQVLPALTVGGGLRSTLILSPPGGGKTTLLRDLIRRISAGIGTMPLRVGVADERGELCALYHGVPQMEVGPLTDVMDGCPKEEGLMMLLRGMNPQVLAADEITAPGDIAALETAANCGVILLATAHARSLEDLGTRPLYQRLLSLKLFQRAVLIEREQGIRQFHIFSLEKPLC
ncbi:MAG: stage III sporulation protein AB [Oscillospiraceae bacterium]|nr:stage III sporulation protein AB [Oscillospiraceae bacterium]